MIINYHLYGVWCSLASSDGIGGIYHSWAMRLSYPFVHSSCTHSFLPSASPALLSVHKHIQPPRWIKHLHLHSFPHLSLACIFILASPPHFHVVLVLSSRLYVRNCFAVVTLKLRTTRKLLSCSCNCSPSPFDHIHILCLLASVYVRRNCTLSLSLSLPSKASINLDVHHIQVASFDIHMCPFPRHVGPQT